MISCDLLCAEVKRNADKNLETIAVGIVLGSFRYFQRTTIVVNTYEDRIYCLETTRGKVINDGMFKVYDCL